MKKILSRLEALWRFLTRDDLDTIDRAIKHIDTRIENFIEDRVGHNELDAILISKLDREIKILEAIREGRAIEIETADIYRQKLAELV